MDLYQLKKPEIFSILVWNQDMAHHRNSPDIGVDEDWICRAWKRIRYSVVFCILAPPRPTSLDGVLGGCVTTRQTQIAVHGVLCAFIPINRCPLTCPWTPPVPSLNMRFTFKINYQLLDLLNEGEIKLNGTFLLSLTYHSRFLPFNAWN